MCDLYIYVCYEGRTAPYDRKRSHKSWTEKQVVRDSELDSFF